MGRLFLLLLIAVPVLEIVVFIKVGGAIGVFPTLLLLLLSAVVGIALVRRQGVQTIGRLQAAVEAGGDPSGPLAHGALILVAGILLFIPGFMTDILGLLLMIPPLRAALIRRGASGATVRAATYIRVRPVHPGPASDAIDVEFEDVPPEGPRRPGGPGSGWTKPL